MVNLGICVRLPLGVGGALLLGLLGAVTSAAAPAPPTYHAITPSMAERTVILTGRDLTLDQVVQVARYGAKVALAAEARQRSADAHSLLLEAAAEGVSVYWFNRG
jgi:histidine ammonia-lyase